MSDARSIPKPSDELAPRPADRLLQPFQRFMSLGASGGVALILMGAAAMAWANSPWAHNYFDLFEDTKLTIGIGGWGLSKPLILWINDLLMALFFLLVGMEIKREVLRGELNSVRKAALPVAAAIGGMVVPALIFTAINWGETTVRGWGVPMATDIAFALGVLSLAGRRVPPALGVFLTTLAIADDLGALVVIATFYSDDLSMNYLAMAGACLAVLILLNVLGFRHPLPFILVGVVLWYFVLKSGVHATIAGVVVAMTIPTTRRVDQHRYVRFVRGMIDRFEAQIERLGPWESTGEQQAAVFAIEKAGKEVETPLRRLEQQLVPWTAFLILPLFALANAGVEVDLGGGGEGRMPVRVLAGAGLGLLFGKPAGVLAASWLAVKLGIAELPRGVRWAHIHGAGWLAGIGFTMALFIANLAYVSGSDLDAAKLGVLGGSVVAGIIGSVLLMTTRVEALPSEPTA